MRKRPKIIRTSQLKEHISKMVMEQGRDSGSIGSAVRQEAPESARSIFDAADALISLIEIFENRAQNIRECCIWEDGAWMLPEYLDSLSDTKHIEDLVQEFHVAVDRAIRSYERDNDAMAHFEKKDKILDLIARVVKRKLGK